MTWVAVSGRPCAAAAVDAYTAGQAKFFGRYPGRGLHSSTSQLNLRVFYGIGGARRNCVARGKGVLGGV